MREEVKLKEKTIAMQACGHLWEHPIGQRELWEHPIGQRELWKHPIGQRELWVQAPPSEFL